MVIDTACYHVVYDFIYLFGGSLKTLCYFCLLCQDGEASAQTTRCHDAAGQVYELATDGSVMIRWASGQLDTCYPQDLYLLGDEVRVCGSARV